MPGLGCGAQPPVPEPEEGGSWATSYMGREHLGPIAAAYDESRRCAGGLAPIRQNVMR
jgi:hypothetical protein